MSLPHESSQPESVHESLLKMDVGEVRGRNLGIIGAYTKNPDAWPNGAELVTVPDYYLTEGVGDLTAFTTITSLAQAELHSFFNGSKPLLDEQSYGKCIYWSFDHENQTFYVTETEIFADVPAAAFTASPITAGINVRQPQRMKELLAENDSEVPTNTASLEDIVREQIPAWQTLPENKHNDIFARLGRRLIRWGNRIDPLGK